MSAVDKPGMTRDQYHLWAAAQAKRHELVEGVPVAMAPERLGHARLKAKIWRFFAEAIEREGLNCEALPDGVTVVIDRNSEYEPDVVVHCGPPDPDEELAVSNPVIVVEVSSRRTSSVDSGAKLSDYFRVDSIRHYLIVRSDRQAVIHHSRGSDGQILTRVVTAGRLSLDPPGLELDVDALYRR